jgi:hypothetical protein
MAKARNLAVSRKASARVTGGMTSSIAKKDADTKGAIIRNIGG